MSLSWGEYLTKGISKPKEIILTGFGNFGEISKNPTEELVLLLQSEFSGQNFKTQILEVSKNAVDEFYSKIQPNSTQIIIHMGVYSGSTSFHIETKGWNNMTFSIPDVQGFQPEKEKICEDFDFDSSFESEFPLDRIAETLTAEGFNCELSINPGRYICNYVYYKSLHHFQSHNNQKKCVFLHVPLFQTIPKETQLAFVKRFIQLITHKI